MGKPNQTTYLLIRNRTPWDISGTYQHISGHTLGALPHTIKAGQDSHLLTASQTTAAHGAEGRWYLEVGAEADRDDRTMRFKHTCSVAKDGNEFKPEQVSPFVRVEARFGNGQPTADDGWGSTTFPNGGSPLGVQLTISEQPPVTEFTLLTYNTHLFAGSDGAIVKPSTVYKDDERMAELVRRVEELDPDILCLQEVWAEHRQVQLAAQLKHRYPYIHILPEQPRPKKPPKTSWQALAVAIGSWPALAVAFTENLGDVDDWDGFLARVLEIAVPTALKNTSGLMVASKSPILQPHFTKYQHAHKVEDAVAAKGALRFKLRLRVTENRAIDVAFATTHALTRVEPDALNNISLLAQQTFGHYRDCDAILAGDFNIHATADAEYQQLTEILDRWGAVDVLKDFPIGMVWTDWPNGNVLYRRVHGTKPYRNPQPDESKQNRIDYVVHRRASSDQSPHFAPDVPDGVSVFNWRPPQDHQQSDRADHEQSEPEAGTKPEGGTKPDAAEPRPHGKEAWLIADGTEVSDHAPVCVRFKLVGADS